MRESETVRRCFIFAAGDFYGLWREPEPGDLVIAADAGYQLCRKLNIQPDLVLGDFDSMTEPDFPRVLRYPVEKDDTDAMLAVKEGRKQGCDTFYFYGCTGGTRPDHTIANYQALLYLRRTGARGYLYDSGMIWTAIEDETLYVGETVRRGVLSVFAMNGTAEGVTLSGVKYPLENGSLSPAFPLGVGNHFAGETAMVSVRRGALLVGWELPEVSS